MPATYPYQLPASAWQPADPTVAPIRRYAVAGGAPVNNVIGPASTYWQFDYASALYLSTDFVLPTRFNPNVNPKVILNGWINSTTTTDDIWTYIGANAKQQSDGFNPLDLGGGTVWEVIVNPLAAADDLITWEIELTSHGWTAGEWVSLVFAIDGGIGDPTVDFMFAGGRIELGIK